MSISGKALLHVTRTDSEWIPFEVETNILTGGGDPSGYSPTEDFELLESGALPLPAAANKLKPGERITFAVSYEFIYRRDYWGECDVDLEYNRVRVLRRRPPAKVKGTDKCWHTTPDWVAKRIHRKARRMQRREDRARPKAIGSLYMDDVLLGTVTSFTFGPAAQPKTPSKPVLTLNQ